VFSTYYNLVKKLYLFFLFLGGGGGFLFLGGGGGFLLGVAFLKNSLLSLLYSFLSLGSTPLFSLSLRCILDPSLDILFKSFLMFEFIIILLYYIFIFISF